MIAEILFIIFFTLLLVGLLVPVGGYRTRTSAYRDADRSAGVAAASLFYFLVLFPLIWAISAWVEPYGPVTLGIYWLPIFLAGLLLALLIAAVSPRPTRNRSGVDSEEATAGFGVLFFVLVILSIVLALAAGPFA